MTQDVGFGDIRRHGDIHVYVDTLKGWLIVMVVLIIIGSVSITP